MSIQNVDVMIASRNYRFATPQGQENRLKALAARVDALVDELKNTDPSMERDRQLIVTCLQLASDVADAQQKLDEQATAVTQFHRSLTERLEKITPAAA